MSRAKTSRRAIQRVLRPRTRLRQGRRPASARPHRSRRRRPLSAARCAGRLDPGAASRFCRSGAAAVDPSRRSLVRRCPPVRRLAAVARERPMSADDIGRDRQFHRQSLRGHRPRRGHVRALSARSERPADAAPACHARHRSRLVLHARRCVVDRQRLARSPVVDPAAAVPLGALIVTEGILRRHAPKAIKTVALAGAVLFGIGGALGFEISPTSYSIALSLFQLAGFAACAVAARRGIAAVAGLQNRAIGRLVAGAIMVIPFIVTDFRALVPDIPVRLGALGALLVVTAVLIAGGGSETRRQGILMTALRLLGPPRCSARLRPSSRPTSMPRRSCGSALSRSPAC